MMSRDNFEAILKVKENFHSGPHWTQIDFETNIKNSVKTIAQYILSFGLPDLAYVDGNWQNLEYLNLKRLLVLEESTFGQRYVLAEASWVGDLERQVAKMLDDKGYFVP